MPTSPRARRRRDRSTYLSATGPVAVDEAWERYTRPRRWSSWAPQIRDVSTTAEVVAAGASGVVHGPLLVRVPFRVRRVDHDTRRWTWQVGAGPLTVTMDHGVDVTDDGTRAWVRVHAPRVLVLPYAGLVVLALRRLVRPP